MSNNWLKTFKDSKEKFLYDIVALEVYDDIAQEIADDKSLSSADSKREKLYIELENEYDKTSDAFIKLVIAQSFVTGKYHIVTNLSKFETFDVYKGNSGKRYNEFSKQIYDSAVNIVEYLVSSEIQFQLACQIVGIAVQRGNKTKSDLKGKILSWVNKIELGSDEELTVSKIEFLIPALHYLLKDKTYRTSELLSKIKDMLSFAINQGDTAKSERAQYNEMGFYCIFPSVFQLEISYFQKLNDVSQVKKVIKKFAETHENLGEKRAVKGDVSNIEGAIMHYENAVSLYKKQGLNNELSKAKKTLDNLKQKMHSMPNPNRIVRHRNLFNYLSKDAQNIMQEILDNFGDLSIHDQIKQLISYLPQFSKDQITQVRKRNKLDNSFFELFVTEITNEYEQTIFKTDDEESKESYALFNYIQKCMILCGKMLEKIVKENKTIIFSDILSEVKSVSKRRHLFIKAFELFFNGDVYAALYILTPQVEWWFREVTYNAGGQTSNLNSFPIEEAKTLPPIFDSNELKEFLGEEQHWLFKQLMIKEPMNIRNKIAHGLELNDNGYCAYFILCVLKLLFEETSE